MHKRISLVAGLAAFFAMGLAHAQYVCPPVTPLKLIVADNVNPETGHTFDVYKANGICWADAQAFVASLPAMGSPATFPHLATLTSTSENQWVVSNLLTPALAAGLTQSQVWIGGFRDAAATGGWRWVNAEGPFSGTNGAAGFTNWSSAPGQLEPNNTAPGENNVTLGRFSNLAAWNDEGSAVGSIGGFIVEYDTPLTAANCQDATDGAEVCTTVKGQTLTFPTGSFTSGNISFTAFEFNDPRIDPSTGKCSGTPTNPRGPLVLFNDAAFGGAATLTIPEYLCGSPKFLVVKVETNGFDIKQGGVLIENNTDQILPGNLWQCFAPILGRVPALSDLLKDPQNQDVVVWQSTDPSKMLEGGVATSPYIGTATEVTNGCGSSKGISRTGSYFVVGMHIDFNLPDAYPLNAAANYASFYALTQYKLNLLLQSVRNARSSLVIRNPEGRAMESQVQNAINAMNAGNPASALSSMSQFLKKVGDSTYVTDGLSVDLLNYNYNGDHLMRGENIAFTLRVKVIPYKPVP